MSRYVDGFVIAVPKKKAGTYRKMARLGAKVWKEHGALEYTAKDRRPTLLSKGAAFRAW